MRDARIAKATDLGVVERGVAVSPPVGTLSPWDDLTPEQKKTAARKMEVYAAMIDRLDWNVGRLIAFLEENQLRDNTLILFLSDNGAEGHLMEAYPSFVPWLAENYDNRYDNIGRKGSFASLRGRLGPCGKRPISTVQGLYERRRHQGAGDRQFAWDGLFRQDWQCLFDRDGHCAHLA